MKTLFVSFFSLLSVFSFAQDSDRWKHIGDAKPGVAYYAADIKQSKDGSLDFWLKTLYLEDIPNGKKGEYAIIKCKVLCTTKQRKSLYYNLYDSEGNSKGESGNLNEEYEDVYPDSTAEKIVNYVCSKPL
jgi:hypothetical protein